MSTNKKIEVDEYYLLTLEETFMEADENAVKLCRVAKKNQQYIEIILDLQEQNEKLRQTLAYYKVKQELDSCEEILQKQEKEKKGMLEVLRYAAWCPTDLTSAHIYRFYWYLLCIWC